MEKENEKVLASGPKGDETAAGENSNYGTELQKGGGRDELEEREEVEKPPPSPFFYSSKQTPPLSPFEDDDRREEEEEEARGRGWGRQPVSVPNERVRREGHSERERVKDSGELSLEDWTRAVSIASSIFSFLASHPCNTEAALRHLTLNHLD
ncbi:unnamed protein product [Pleuronectes platessa]|uniref:Uncharacterized protein n=1 Tax=Pleuronectes platessa TaxID=8262 RepID=A0A9N7W1G4_PLEPL|nr:unnamed protein product [Pleuronectes platessa]